MLGKVQLQETNLQSTINIESAPKMTSVYSASVSSSKHSGLKRRTQTHVQPPVSEIRQRVLSARMLRFRTMQNQLTLSQHQIHDLEQENRSLKTTIRRQEKALDKYDNANAELPRLLKNHQEEIRIWNEKSKVLHKQIKDLTTSLKQREQALLMLTDQNKHFQQLNRDRHLEEREKLFERVKELEHRLSDRDNELKLLARKHQLDTKMLRTQFHQEQGKSRDLQLKLDKANMEITRLNLLELDKGRATLTRYRHNLRETQSASTNLSYAYHSHFYNQPGDQHHLKVQSCSNSYYSRSPQCDSSRHETLYEDEDQEEEIEASYEEQKRVHLEQTKIEKEKLDANDPREIGHVINAETNIESIQVAKVPATDIGEQDLIAQFESLNRKDIEEKEAILDKICDSVIQANTTDSSSSNSSPKSRITVKKVKPSKVPEHSGAKKKQPIDPRSKTKLLAALKAIDADESVDTSS